MTRTDEHNPDPSQDAASIASQATDVELEAAWAAWLESIEKVDEHSRKLLRAAFDAGYEAGKCRRL